MYEPREDSFLMLKAIKQFAKGHCLDIGTGSGILAYEANKLVNVKSIMAIDIDKESIDYTEKKYNIKVIKSDMFEKVKGKFDTIIINPPYLPKDKDLEDKTIFGGEKGFEYIEKFLGNAKKYLAKDGIILLLFSSLTNKEKIKQIIRNNNLKYEQVEYLKLDFEELYVYLIK